MVSPDACMYFTQAPAGWKIYYSYLFDSGCLWKVVSLQDEDG